jgi:hypothetical protein
MIFIHIDNRGWYEFGADFNLRNTASPRKTAGAM